MTAFLDQVLGAAPWAVLLVVGLVVFAEDALFVGFVLPGETAAILGGVAAHRGHVAFAAVLAVVIVAAIVGDSVGYEVGRLIGPRVLASRIVAKRRERIEGAQDFLARRGGWAVLLGRWVAFFRAVMPALAGLARMPYHVFLPFNAAGGIVWGSVVVSVGYLAGASYAAVEKKAGDGLGPGRARDRPGRPAGVAPAQAVHRATLAGRARRRLNPGARMPGRQRYCPVRPSMHSRSRSAWPACRAYSSIRWTRTSRTDTVPSRCGTVSPRWSSSRPSIHSSASATWCFQVVNASSTTAWSGTAPSKSSSGASGAQ